MNARPYIKRAFNFWWTQSDGDVVTVSLVLFFCCRFWRPLLSVPPQTLGDAAQGGDWSSVWSLTGSFYDTERRRGAPVGPSDGHHRLARHSALFTTISLFGRADRAQQCVDIVSRLGRREVRAAIAHRTPAKTLSTSIAFARFLYGRTNRSTNAKGTVRDHVSAALAYTSLLTPVIDVIVMVIVIGYMLALSWQ